MKGRGLFFFLAAILLGSELALAGGNCPSGYCVNRNHDDGISFDLLKKKIQADPKIQTLENALSLIPADFFRFHVLVYRSRSLQQSSFLYPRAIVFGQSGKFIFAFNGHPDHRGYNKMEIIQFREKERRWEFREISFTPGEQPKISEANPKRCLECHQSPNRTDVDMRPNWEPYNFWPGVYGSLDSAGDTMHAGLKENYTKFLSGDSGLYEPIKSFLPQDFFLIEEQAQEAELFARFTKETKPLHNRYSFLPEYATRNVLGLTKIIVTLNFDRVVRLMQESLGPLYHVYKYAVSGLSGPTNYESSEGWQHRCFKLYFPEPARSMHLEALRKLKKLDERAYAPKDSIYDSQFSISKGFELIFEPLGIDTSDWSTDFKTGGRFGIDGGERFASPNSSAAHLFWSLKKWEAELVEPKCEETAAKSHEAISTFEKSGQLAAYLTTVADRPVPPQQPLINRCINCHAGDGSDFAPRIPFDNFNELKPLLNKGNYPRGHLIDEIRYRTSDHATNYEQMPPSGRVKPELRDELVKTLTDLSNN